MVLELTNRELPVFHSVMDDGDLGLSSKSTHEIVLEASGVIRGLTNVSEEIININ